MDIFPLNELTDDMMNLCDDEFYNFLENTLNKDLCELFRIQSIRHMTSLSSITIDQILEIFSVDIIDMDNLKKSLGFVTIDRKFHVLFGHRNLLEMWRQTSSSSKATSTPILFPWINNIFQNLEKTKNKYRYNDQIQEFVY
ncbi:unnamed protein product [Rotaria magnacalcarata]|uniref:Uncharacterized protein n=1 Tax=Rotaria magnacalcarata TaxID=392030 RepID=A0A820D0C6_9BILA|nr:unnamed protein product [Rotaria magnacalcarata]CAF4226102.1 unnamed protein product [Rotaria magnacalcarata]